MSFTIVQNEAQLSGKGPNVNQSTSQGKLPDILTWNLKMSRREKCSWTTCQVDIESKGIIKATTQSKRP